MATFEETTLNSESGFQFSIRSAQACDGENVLNFGKRVMDESSDVLLTMPDELDLTPEQESNWQNEMERNPNNLALVAIHKSEVVGFLDFSSGHRRRIAHTGEFGMSVEKKFRRNGIGSALLDCLISWANNNSQIEKLNLQVHATNKPAIALYESKGFTVEGIRKKELKYSQNQYVDSVLMAAWV